MDCFVPRNDDCLILLLEIGTNSIKSLLFNRRELIYSFRPIYNDKLIYFGTNKCVPYKNDINFEIIKENVYNTRLGEGLYETGILSDFAIERNINVIKNIIEEYKILPYNRPSRHCEARSNPYNRPSRHCEARSNPYLIQNNVLDCFVPRNDEIQLHIIATQALRTAKNIDIFKNKIKQIFSIDIKVLCGEEEALCSYYSQYPDLKEIVLDIGGGSTEIIYSKTNPKCVSYPIGAVYLKDLCGNNFYNFITIDDFIDYAFKIIEKIIILDRNIPHAHILSGIGGSFTALAKLHKNLDSFDANQIEGTEISLDETFNILKTIHQASKSFIINDGRSDIIPYGIVILLFVMTKLNIKKITVSCKGVRHGYIVIPHLYQRGKVVENT